ncbi:MAG: ROK family protein [Candidatus Orphnella occulta]|nr:ROK family protein [Candidatus Orphnella occulta]
MRRIIGKCTSWLVIVTFMLTNISWAAPLDPVSSSHLRPESARENIAGLDISISLSQSSNGIGAKSSSSGVVDANEISKFIIKLVGKGNEQKASDAIKAEAVETGRPIFAVGRGIMGRDRDPAKDDGWFMAHSERGPPVDFLYVGGGGEGITTFVQAIVESEKNHLPYKQYKRKYESIGHRIIGVINNGAFDDGGNTASVRMDIHDSDEWPNEVTTLCGDIMSIVSYATTDEAKIYFLDDSFRIDAVVNINKANINMLQHLFDKETAKAILKKRAKLKKQGKDGFTKNTSKDKQGKDVVDFPEIKDAIISVNGEYNGEKIYKVVKSRLTDDKESKAKVLESVKERFEKIQDKIDKGILERPADWIFFVSNMMALAMIIDKYLIKTHDIKLIGSKWQNLMDLAIKIEAQQIQRGNTDIVFDRTEDKLYEALGIAAAYALGVSSDDATMAAILEASTLKIIDNGFEDKISELRTFEGKAEAWNEYVGKMFKESGVEITEKDRKNIFLPAQESVGKAIEHLTQRLEQAAILIGPKNPDEYCDISIKRVKVEISGDIMATSLNMPGETISIANGEEQPLILAGQEVVLKNNNSVLEVSINESEPVSIYETEEGKTRVKIASESKVIPLDAEWDSLKIGNAKVSIKSRMVEEQTFVTDEVHASRTYKLVFKKAGRLASKKYDYEKVDDDNVDSKDKLDKSGLRKVRKFGKPLLPREHPGIDDAASEIIEGVRKAFVYGEGGMITSLLPNLLVRDVVEKIHEEISKGALGVWYPKLTEDFETKDLSLKEQMGVLDRSISQATGNEHGFSNIVTDVILPDVPESIKERADKFFKEAEESYEAHSAKIAAREEKISKYFPMGLASYAKDNVERQKAIDYLEGKGIRVHLVSNFDFNSMKKLVWNKRELYKTIEMIATRERLLDMIDDENRREKIRQSLRSVKDSFTGIVFWPLSEWHKIFDAIGKNKNKLEKVSIVFNESKLDEKVFEVMVPQESEFDRQKEIIGLYLTVCIYNRLAAVGAKSLTIYSSQWIYDEIAKRLEHQEDGNEYALMGDFLTTLYYDGKGSFTIEHKIPSHAIAGGGKLVVPKQSDINLEPIKQGTIVGVALNDKYLRAVILKKGQVVDTAEQIWQPEKIENPQQYIERIKALIANLKVDLADVEVVGISWPAAVYENRILGKAGKMVSGIKVEDFKNIADLASELSRSLNGKGVIIVNNGNAAAHVVRLDSPEYQVKYDRKTLVLSADASVSASYIDKSGVITDALGELGNVVIDMNIDAPWHSYTKVRGVLQQYFSAPGLIRLANSLLMGDLMPGEIKRTLGTIYQEICKEHEEDFSGAEMQPEEFLRQDPDKFAPEQKRLYQQMINEISTRFANKIMDFRKLYANMWTVLLPSEVNALDESGEIGTAGELNKTVIKKIAETSKEIMEQSHDSRVAIVLADELDFATIYGQWNNANPQAALIIKNIGMYLAETIVEMRQYFDIENVIIQGSIMPHDLALAISELTIKELKDRYGIEDMKVDTLFQTVLERPFTDAKGAAYAAALKRDTAVKAKPKTSSAGNDKLDSGSSLAVEKLLDQLKDEDMLGQMRFVAGLDEVLTPAEMAGYRAAYSNNKFLDIGFDYKKDKKTDQITTYLNRLGWTTDAIARVLDNPKVLADIIIKAAEIRERYDYVIFCGMGGSRLCIDTVRGVFGEPKDIKMFTLGTTDSSTIDDIVTAISEDAGSLQEALKKTLVVAISKSATTKETLSHKQYFEDLFISSELFGENPLNPDDHLLFITDKDAAIYKQATPENRQDRMMLIQLDQKTDMGGRYTAPATTIPLLPLAIIAGDKAQEFIITLLNKAIDMNNISDIHQDRFIELGAFLYYMAAIEHKDKLTLILPEDLKAVAPWSEQLFEESLGKHIEKGITVIYNEDISSDNIKSLLENDRVFLRFKFLDQTDSQEGFWKHLVENGYPVRQIEVDNISSLGGIELGLQRAVATIGYLWDINFVDQPAVDGYKKATNEVMDALAPNAHVTIPFTTEAKYQSLKLYWQPLVDADAINEEQLRAEVKELGSDITDAPAVYAAIIRLLIENQGFEVAELAPWANMTSSFEKVMKQVRYDIFTAGLKMPSKLAIHPDGNHSFQQNVEGGRNIFFSTYMLGMKMRQPKVQEYEPELLKAQAIGTVNSLVDSNRKVVLLVTDNELVLEERVVEGFFDKVEQYLAKTSSSGESRLAQEKKLAIEAQFNDLLEFTAESDMEGVIKRPIVKFDLTRDDFLSFDFAMILEHFRQLARDKFGENIIMDILPSMNGHEGVRVGISVRPDSVAVEYKSSSAGILLTDNDLVLIELAAEIADLSDATGTIVYNDTTMSTEQQIILSNLLGKGTPGLADLEVKLGCNVRLMSQGDVSDDTNTIIVSTEQLPGFHNVRYFITEQAQIDTSYIAITPLIAIAKGLLGFEDRTSQPELYEALKSSIRSLSQGLLNESDIEAAITAYMNGNPMFVKLPPAAAYDYDKLEQLYRQALMVLIAA